MGKLKELIMAEIDELVAERLAKHHRNLIYALVKADTIYPSKAAEVLGVSVDQLYLDMDQAEKLDEDERDIATMVSDHMKDMIEKEVNCAINDTRLEELSHLVVLAAKLGGSLTQTAEIIRGFAGFEDMSEEKFELSVWLLTPCKPQDFH